MLPLALDCLTGKSRQHLALLPLPYSTAHFLQPPVVEAFQGLQQAAKKAGFNLQPASSFRDFTRQKWIWDNKFNGIRKVHNDQGENINLSLLNEWQKCLAILRWSALPGASRHHWGTEIDVFDPDLLPKGQSLQLEPQEYQQNGYFAPLVEFLQQHLSDFDFYLPFLELPQDKKVGVEPWHISYRPIAEKLQPLLTLDVLLEAWKDETIAGKKILTKHLQEIFDQFIL